AAFLEFGRKATALTCRSPVLQRRRFFLGADCNAAGVPALERFGTRLDQPAWRDPAQRTLCYRLDGSEEAAGTGNYVLFLILNAHHETQWGALPPPRHGGRWYRIIDTSLPAGQGLRAPGPQGARAPAGD